MDAVLARERFRHVVFVDGVPEGIPALDPWRAGHLFPGKLAARRVQKAARPSPRWDEAEPAPPGSERQLQFLGWLFDKVSLDVTAYRPGSLLRRLPACLRALRAEGVEHAVRLLTRNGALVGAAIDTLLIG